MECIKCKAEVPEGAIFCPWCGRKQSGPPLKKYRKRSNGTGSIYKLQGRRAKPWAATKNRILIGTFATRGEAQKALERITDQDISDKYNLTFAQVYEAWRPVHAREVTKGQMQSYAGAYKACTALHDQKFRTLRKSDFEAELIKREEAGYAKSTCEKMLQLFGQLSKWALEEGIVLRNHAANVRTVATQKSEGNPFTTEEIKLILSSSAPAAQIAAIMLATGARPGEVLRAELEHCHDGFFIGGSKTEAGRDRCITVAQFGLPAYNDLRARSMAAGGSLLVSAYEGNKDVKNFAQRDFKPLMTSLGLEGHTPYDCRHTYITLATRSGVPPQILRRLVGHASLTTTDKIYTHLDYTDLLDGSSRITLG